MKSINDLDLEALSHFRIKYDLSFYYCKTTNINYLSHTPDRQISGLIHPEAIRAIKEYCELTGFSFQSIRTKTTHHDSDIIYISNFWSFETGQYPIPVLGWMEVDNYTKHWDKSFYSY